MPFRRAKATSEQGQPRVRCPLTKESSGVASLPSEPPRRALPTGRTPAPADVRGVSNGQASSSSTLSPCPGGLLIQRGAPCPLSPAEPTSFALPALADRVDAVRQSRPSTRLRGAPVGVVRTRSTLSQRGQQVTNRSVSNKNGNTQRAHHVHQRTLNQPPRGRISPGDNPLLSNEECADASCESDSLQTFESKYEV